MTDSLDTNWLSPGARAMLLSTLAFFLANSFVKQVGNDVPAMEIVFFRCIIATVICTAGLLRARASIVGSNHTMLLLRGIFGTTALFTFFVTLQHIPLAPAQTLQYLSPIFTTVIAIFVLKEAVAIPQFVFYAVAFGGVLLIDQVDDRVSPFYTGLGVLSGFCSGMAYNLVRSLRGKEHPLTVVFHFQATGAVVGFFFLFFDWKTPYGWDWFYLVCIGVFSQLGQVFLTKALQSEAVAGVAILNYTGLVYAITAGWIIFGEPQSLPSIGGMALVVVGVLMSVLYGRRKQRLAAIEATAA
ncbi:MAG: DMT family transporter [Acidobacteria bacterium]|nr:DMT family transporter [Acidobacteriota bacterium]